MFKKIWISKSFKGISVTKDTSGFWCSTIRIPHEHIGEDSESPAPLRINVSVDMLQDGIYTWPHSNNPITPRLSIGSDNPADLGWLVFKNGKEFIQVN